MIRENLAEAVGVTNPSDIPDERALVVAPLYAGLPWEQQLRALEPSHVTKSGVRIRKVIVVGGVLLCVGLFIVLLIKLGSGAGHEYSRDEFDNRRGCVCDRWRAC